MPAHNWRFGASGGVARLKVSADFQVLLPSEHCEPPPERQAAATLGAMRGQHSGHDTVRLKISAI